MMLTKEQYAQLDSLENKLRTSGTFTYTERVEFYNLIRSIRAEINGFTLILAEEHEDGTEKRTTVLKFPTWDALEGAAYTHIDLLGGGSEVLAFHREEGSGPIKPHILIRWRRVIPEGEPEDKE